MTWHKILHREGVDITTISGIDIQFFRCIANLTKGNEEHFFTFCTDRQLTHYSDVDFLTLGRSLYQKYFNTPLKIERHYTQGKEILKTIKSTTGKWKRRKTMLLLPAFKEFRKQFEQICHIYSITSWIAIEAWQREAEELITTLLEKNNIKDKDALLFSLYKPWKKTAILEIQDKLKRGVSSAQLVQEYQFLRSWVAVWYTPLDENWILGLKSSVEHDIPIISQEQIFEQLKPSPKERKFLAMAPYIIFFKDWRDDVRRQAVYLWSFLFDALARHWNIPRDDIGYLTLDEIEKALKSLSLPVNVIISHRKQHPCVITSQENKLNVKIIDFPIPEQYPTIMLTLETPEKEQQIKGYIAYRGKVRGMVRIVHSYHDIKKIQPGEILVANTTHPTYVPGMQKAAAFVTNEGGIASHAAVVARELMKPCIVGTRIATKVLQDGDFVEVDADNGIVFKITTNK